MLVGPVMCDMTEEILYSFWLGPDSGFFWVGDDEKGLGLDTVVWPPSRTVLQQLFVPT